MLGNEVHHILNKKEMDEILEFREQLAYKTTEETDDLFYNWAVTGQLSPKEHKLLAIYIYNSN